MFPPIYSLLRASAEVCAILGGNPRLFQDEAQQGVAKPYGVWTVISAVPENTLSETPGHERASIQLDLYCENQQQRESLGNAVRAQLETATHVTAWRTDREPVTLSWRLSLDFDYWLARET